MPGSGLWPLSTIDSITVNVVAVPKGTVRPKQPKLRLETENLASSIEEPSLLYVNIRDDTHHNGASTSLGGKFERRLVLAFFNNHQQRAEPGNPLAPTYSVGLDL